jgi:hypothetical protein
MCCREFGFSSGGSICCMGFGFTGLLKGLKTLAVSVVKNDPPFNTQ